MLDVGSLTRSEKGEVPKGEDDLSASLSTTPRNAPNDLLGNFNTLAIIIFTPVLAYGSRACAAVSASCTSTGRARAGTTPPPGKASLEAKSCEFREGGGARDGPLGEELAGNLIVFFWLVRYRIMHNVSQVPEADRLITDDDVIFIQRTWERRFIEDQKRGVSGLLGVLAYLTTKAVNGHAASKVPSNHQGHLATDINTSVLLENAWPKQKSHPLFSTLPVMASKQAEYFSTDASSSCHDLPAPGTEYLYDANGTHEALQHVSDGNDHILLVPQPSLSDVNDPLRWPRWKKWMTFANGLAYSFLGGVTGPIMAAAFDLLAARFDERCKNWCTPTGRR